MIGIDLAFPFAAGLVAAFNPCGFAMLPTYLAYFMGLEDAEARSGPARNVLRGLTVGLVMTAGFFAVFGAFGLVTSHLVSRSVINEWIPWATLVLGVLMVPLGVAMLAGFEPKLRLPRMERGTGNRQLSSVFLFGTSYATVSLTCTTPVFMTAVVSSFTRDGIGEGLSSFLAYAAGMAVVVVALTMAVAVARGSIARNLGRVLPYVQRTSGALLVLAGLYLTLYGWWAVRVLDDPTTASNRVQQAVERLQVDISNWMNDVGVVRVGTVLGVAIGVAVGAAAAWQWRSARRAVTPPDEPSAYGANRSMRQPDPSRL